MNKLQIQAQAKSLEGGQFEVVASTGTMDRLGDKINPEGWYLTNYKKDPVMLWAHDAFSPPVARAEKVWVEDKQLKAKGTFAPTPFAQELRVLVENGFLNAVSVGFLPLLEDEKGNIDIEGKIYRRAEEKEIKGLYQTSGVKFEKQELLEISWVNVPALPQALVTARKMELPLMIKALVDNDKQENEIKPFPNEHSCRLELPDKYKRFRRQNCKGKHDGKCIDFIFGITEDEKPELQSMRYDKKEWKASEAKSHCKENDGTFEAAGEEQLADINIKEGRVISEKNRVLIKNCVKQMGVAIGALEELLITTEPEKSITPSGDKGRTLLEAEGSNKAKLVLLKRTSVAIDNVLRTYKKGDRNEKDLTLLRIADKVVEAMLIKAKAEK